MNEGIGMSRQRKKIIVIILALAAVLVVAGLLMARPTSTTKTPTATTGSTGSGGEPTASGLAQPPSSAPSNQPTPVPTAAPGATPAPKGTVKPIISTLPYVSAGQVHLRAYAEGASGGTCQLTLTHPGSPAVTASAPTTTQGVCQGFDIDAAPLAKGEWTATVSVNSPALEGTSDEAKFTIN